MEGRLRDTIRQKVVAGIATPPPAFTRRDVRLPGIPGKAVAVVGMRRTGKTTFLWQCLADRAAAGVGREGLLFFGFEDERLAGMEAGDLHLVLEEYYRLHPQWRSGRGGAFFLDEIQVVPGWETFVRRLLDSEPLDVFLSGSSARLLSREVATSMRGRAMEVRVHPFGLREFTRYFGREPRVAFDRLGKAARSAAEKDLRDLLAGGGFPEALGAAARDRFDLLRGYVDLVLLRDVIERHAVANPVALRWMVRQLLGNAAGQFSVSRFYRDLKSQGVAVAKDSLHEFLGFLEDAFLIRTLAVATASERQRMVNPRKVYPADPGLIPIFDRARRANLGHALETAVLHELERRGADVAYVRTPGGYEVDFLACGFDGREELIQVCADLDDPGTREREIRALLDAAAEHPAASLHLVCLEPYGGPPLPAGIALHSAAAWLLDASRT